MNMKKNTLLSITILLISINVFAYSGGNGSKTNPYLISSKADMEELAKNVFVYGGGQTYAGVYFLLTRDLTNEDDVITTVIGYTGSPNPCFNGVFDGGNHKIKVNINSQAFTGIFGRIENATIKNLE